MVSDRIEDALVLEGAIHYFQNKIADGFGEWLSPVLRDGETLPDHAFSLELVGRRVMVAADRLETADREYGAAAVWRARQRDSCEHWARKGLNPLVVDARRQIDAMLGRVEASKVHFLEGKTRRAPEPLLRQVRRLVIGLGDYCGEPRKLRNGTSVDLGDFLAEIEPAHDRLAALMKELTELQGLELQARHRRKAQIKAFDTVYTQALHYVEAMFVLSDVGGRVKKLRSYLQRRRLSRWARSKREAYAAAKMDSGQEPEKRSFAGRIAGWFGRSGAMNRRNVA